MPTALSLPPPKTSPDWDILEDAIIQVRVRENWADDWMINYGSIRWKSHTNAIQGGQGSPISRANFVHDFGWIREGFLTTYEQADLLIYRDWWVQIVQTLPPAGGADEPDDAGKGATDLVLFTGRFTDPEIDYAGIYDEDGADEQVIGRMPMVAEGLDGVLLRHKMNTADVRDTNGLSTIEWIPPMNTRNPANGHIEGNRNDTAETGTYYVYGDDDLWTHAQYAEYILTVDPPIAGMTFALSGAVDELDKLTTQLNVEGLSTTAILNRLIDRRLGFTWHPRVDFDDDIVYIEVRQINAEPIGLGDYEIAANENKVSLKPFQDHARSQCRVRDVSAGSFTNVIARGGRIRVVFSDDVGAGVFEDFWDATNATNYITKLKTEGINEPADPKFHRVYTTFGIAETWNGQIATNPVNVQTEADGTLDTTLTSDLTTLFKRFLPKLPLLIDADYTTDPPTVVDSAREDEFMDPLVTILNVLPVPDRYENAADLSATLATWIRPARIRMLPNELAFECRFSPQYVLGANDAGSFTGKEPVAGHMIFDEDDVTATVAMEIDARLTVTEQIAGAGDGAGDYVIDIPGARLDVLLPETVVGIEDGGDTLKLSPDAYITIRNDKEYLQKICLVAAEWLGRPRAAITFSRRAHDPIANLGDIITEVIDGHHTQNVNSIVTSITHTRKGITLQTAFDHLDAAGLLGAMKLSKPAIEGPPVDRIQGELDRLVAATA